MCLFSSLSYVGWVRKQRQYLLRLLIKFTITPRTLISIQICLRELLLLLHAISYRWSISTRIFYLFCTMMTLFHPLVVLTTSVILIDILNVRLEDALLCLFSFKSCKRWHVFVCFLLAIVAALVVEILILNYGWRSTLISAGIITIRYLTRS